VKIFMDRWIQSFGGFGGLEVVVVGIVGVRVVTRTACLVIGINVWMLWSGGRFGVCLRFVFALLGFEISEKNLTQKIKTKIYIVPKIDSQTVWNSHSYFSDVERGQPL
jgi:hypothetical protein